MMKLCTPSHQSHRRKHQIVRLSSPSKVDIWGRINERKTELNTNYARNYSTATGGSNAVSMEYRRLGSSGLKVSALSFGSWVTFGKQIDNNVAFEIMKTAYDNDFFDNAESYEMGESERVMGEVLKRAKWRRESVIISSKIFWGGSGPNDRGLSRKHLMEGVHNSLKRLQLDYLDLVFCHRPDLHTPIVETVRAMSNLVDRGLAFYWGTSEWSAAQITEAYQLAERYSLIPPTMEQPEYSMVHRERVEKEYKALYSGIGLGITAWSPLKYGLLTGKYVEGVPSDSRATVNYRIQSLLNSSEGKAIQEKVKQLVPIAAELGGTMAQLALAWCLLNKDVSTVITGASKTSQVTENLKALSLVPKLTPDIVQKIESILNNKPQPEIDARAR